MSYYDGFIVDQKVALAGYEQFCSEPLIRLSCCYHPISYGLRRNDSALSRRQLKLPEDSVLVGMLQTPNRIHPPFLDRVVRVLASSPDAHLLLRVQDKNRSRALEYLAHLGIPAERVHFISKLPEREDYLKLISLLDLIVDPHPYGGHSTTGEALSLGVPVVAMSGRSIQTRVALSMMNELGIGDLVAPSMEEMLVNLQTLISDSAVRSQWKERFVAAIEADGGSRHARLTAALEAVYAKAYKAKWSVE